MAFRHSFKGSSFPTGSKILEPRKKVVFNADGSQGYTVSFVDASQSTIPSPDDYTLQALISAGVTLSPVNPAVVCPDVEKIVNNIVQSDSENS